MIAAQIVDGKVTQAIVGTAEWAADRLGGTWVNTETKVGIGWTYTDTDGFRPPQPYASWVWIDNAWTPPTPYPGDENMYEWSEDTLSWVLVDELA